MPQFVNQCAVSFPNVKDYNVHRSLNFPFSLRPPSICMCLRMHLNNCIIVCLRSEPTPAERASEDCMLQQEIKAMTERQRSKLTVHCIITYL